MLLHKRYIACFVFLVFYLQLFPQKTRSLIRFTENKQQWEDFILYRAQLDGGALYAEKTALTYGFYDKETLRNAHANPKAKRAKEIKTTGFKVLFTNSNANVHIESVNPYKDYCNYFIGNNKSHWASNVKNYQKLLYTDLWHGINLEMLGQDNSVKYNFYVKAGGDPSNIQLHYEKIEKISLEKGQLILKTPLNEMVEHEPYAYQLINGETIVVPCDFKLKRNTVSFSFPKGYNKDYELVIDPVLIFACTSGSTSDNFGFCATYDAQGNLYSGGIAFNSGYPTINAYDSVFNSNPNYPAPDVDVVITKYDSSGTYLHYSTYLGGSYCETVTSLIIDAQNNLYMHGATGSSNFPITSQAYDPTYNGGDSIGFTGSGSYFDYGSDLYVAKLSTGGNQLLASTYIGGSANDGLNTHNIPYNVNDTLSASGGESGPDSLDYNYGDQYRGEIQLDNAGNPVISSSSRSKDFPIKNGFDATLGGWQDAVLFKFNVDLSQLVWSTFIGGSNNDAGYGMVIGSNNEVYTTGGTRSSNFPVTKNAIDSVYKGGICDGYITRISKNGDSLLAATYIGTPSYDQSFFIQLDKSDNIYVYGQSLGNMPVISSLYSNPNSKQFVTKYNNTLSTILYSTVLGNGKNQINISPTAFLIDSCENVYISGWGGDLRSTQGTFNMPLTSPTIQSSNPDGYNFYLMQLSQNCNSLMFATYYGGSLSKEHVHGGTSRYDKKGIVYQTLCTSCGGTNSLNVHQDFPLFPANAWPGDSIANHNTDDYNCTEATFKIYFSHPIVKASCVANNQGCAPLTVKFTDASINATSVFWDFGGGQTSTAQNPTKTYTTAGTYTAMLIATNATCSGIDTAFINITVLPSPQASFTSTYDSCVNSVVLQNTSVFTSGTLSYNWNFGNGETSANQNPDTVTYNNPGTYTTTLIAIGSNGCNDTVKQVFSFTIKPVKVYPDTSFCSGKSIQLHASGGISYVWQPSTGLSSSTSSSPVASPTTTTIYTVNILQMDGGGRTCNFILTDSIKVYPNVSASFTVKYDSCINSAVLQNNSVVTGGVLSYTWNFGNGQTSTNPNPGTIVYQPGTYTATLLVSTSNGCNDSSNQVLNFTVQPVQVYPDTSFCSGKSIALHASGGITYTWQPSMSLSSTSSANPIASPTTATIYTVNIFQTDAAGRACNYILTDTITVHPKVTAAFNYSVNLCGNNYLFSDSSYANVTSWYWNFGDGSVDSIQNPTHAYSKPGTYTISLLANNQYNCPDIVDEVINVNGFTPITISKNTVVCKNNPVQLTASGGISYTWTPSYNLNDPTIYNPIATPTATTNYTVFVMQSNTSGDTCTSALYTNITVPFYTSAALTAYAKPDTIQVGGTSQLSTSLTSGHIIWVPDYNLSNDSILNPVASPYHTTTYMATYIDPHGCVFPVSSVTIYVIAPDCNENTVFVPNTFTPNGDGRNDVLYARSAFVTELYFTVYDRWGQQVFATNDINKGWDGIFNGKPCNPDVFGYYLTFKCNDGRESFKKGNVTLIR